MPVAHRIPVPLLAGTAAIAALVLLADACGEDDAAGTAVVEPGPALEPRSGGMTTAFDDTAGAFRLTARNINNYERVVFADGKVLFEEPFVVDPGHAMGGLGPDFYTDSCASCHPLDGRAAGPEGDGVLPVGMIVKLATDDPATVDAYGSQLTPLSATGPAEATTSVTYEEMPGEYADGESYSLRRPIYDVDVGAGPDLADDAVIGVRQGPHLSGLGLLENVALADLEAMADPDDADGDGVSGRLAASVDLLTGEPVVGRFGWNATQPSIEQQTATALFSDMGLTSRYFPTADCDMSGGFQRQGDAVTTTHVPGFEFAEAQAGHVDGDWEITDRELFELTLYHQALTVPAIRDVDDPEVRRGRDLFVSTGCATCHAGPYVTEPGSIEGLGNQVIHPYTDLLLHDMGEGLADRSIGGRPVRSEWRTPPLWGIGLIGTVNGHSDLLHDGRARDLAEAVLWHGGEAAGAAEAFRTMSAVDRAALLAFLGAL